MIAQVDIDIDFKTNSFLKKNLKRAKKDLAPFSARQFKINIHWKKENLRSENRATLVPFLKSRHHKKSGVVYFLPPCLPGWELYSRIQKLVRPDNCSLCPLFQRQCGGLKGSNVQEGFSFIYKRKSEIKLKDFSRSTEDRALTWWMPKQDDIQQLISIAQQAHRGRGLPLIIDAGCGQGFLSFLLAETGKVKVIGIDWNERAIKNSPYSHPHLKLIAGNVKKEILPYKDKADLVINSFIPHPIDLAPFIKRKVKPKAIAYIQDRSPKDLTKMWSLKLTMNEKKGLYRLAKNSDRMDVTNKYKTYFSWPVISINDLKKKSDDESEIISSEIEIQIRKEINLGPPFSHDHLKQSDRTSPYPWEKELKKKRIWKTMALELNGIFLDQYKLAIGNCIIQVSSSNGGQVPLDSVSRRFLTNRSSNIHLKVHYGFLPRLKKKLLFDSEGLWKLYQNGSGHLVSIGPSKAKTPDKIALIKPDLTQCEIFIRTKEPSLYPMADPFCYPLNFVFLSALMAKQGGVCLHAAGVIHDGSGTLFTGVSGAGKTTISLLWESDGKAVISDDRIIVRPQENKRYTIYGTPWHGDAHLALPDSAPLKQIFFLKQALKNKIVPLKPKEAIKRIFETAFVPYWDKKGIGATIDFLTQMIQLIPSYELQFVPKKSIVECVKNHVLSTRH